MNTKRISTYIVATFIVLVIFFATSFLIGIIKDDQRRKRRAMIIENIAQEAYQLKKNIGMEIEENIYLYDVNFNKDSRVFKTTYIVKGTKKFSKNLINWIKQNQLESKKIHCNRIPREHIYNEQFKYIYMNFEYIDSFNNYNTAYITISQDECIKLR